MKFLSLLLIPAVLSAAEPSGIVLLQEAGVKNLGIEIVTVEEADFEESAFALGRIEAIPAKSGSVSSRISGRLVDLPVSVGDTVDAGQVVAKVESRQPGDPPPVIPLTAPLKGMVMHSETRLGDPVEPDKALLEITDLSEVHAIASVPEYQAGAMKPGTKARIKVAALGNQEFAGELLRFGTAADPESGTIDAIFKLANAELLLRPGMRAEFAIVVAVREGLLSVPREAIQGTPANRHVYVKHPKIPHAFEKAPVHTGKTSGDRVEIIDGLYPGDEVVTRGSYSLGYAGGGGGVSIKEAMDAAHGHKHNEDGSEMTPEQIAAEAAKGGGHGHDHEAAQGTSTRELFFMISTGVLVVLLMITALKGRKPQSSVEP